MRFRPAPLLLLLAALALGACDSDSSDDVADLGDLIVVSYEGHLEDGTVFDRSPRASFILEDQPDGLPPGFVSGVLGMRVGESRTFVVPPEDGYGDQQRGPIPPNSTLTFDVELLDVR